MCNLYSLNKRRDMTRACSASHTTVPKSLSRYRRSCVGALAVHQNGVKDQPRAHAGDLDARGRVRGLAQRARPTRPWHCLLRIRQPRCASCVRARRNPTSFSLRRMQASRQLPSGSHRRVRRGVASNRRRQAYERNRFTLLNASRPAPPSGRTISARHGRHRRHRESATDPATYAIAAVSSSRAVIGRVTEARQLFAGPALFQHLQAGRQRADRGERGHCRNLTNRPKGAVSDTWSAVRSRVERR